jgi:hypothetical protein
VKIIDRVKASIRLKKGRDRRSTDYPLDGAADPAPQQRDRATDKQNRDDKRPAVSTAHETPESGPATDPATESAPEPTTDPAPQLATDPITESAAEPAAESATEPTTQPATDPVTESVAEPTTAPAACPRCGAIGEAPCTTPSGKPTKNHKGREQ